ncbi:MAG: ComF family protein [Gallionella sp.]|nr:ComF family protein [Gallionella sp.]
MSILHRTFLNIRSKIERIFPAQPCVLCSQMSRSGLWCAACDASLPYLNEPHCPICALPTLQGELCGRCLSHPPIFSHTEVVFGYAFPLDKLIQAMKYGEQLTLANGFAKKLAQRIAQKNLPDYIIPMPLHPARLKERGFNQSLLLAEKVAQELNLKLLPNACQRVRDTPSQSSLKWKERDKNMRDAFRCNVDLTGKRIALIDDVMTTGASLNALAKTIKKAGATHIETWIIARTLPHNK